MPPARGRPHVGQEGDVGSHRQAGQRIGDAAAQVHEAKEVAYFRCVIIDADIEIAVGAWLTFDARAEKGYAGDAGVMKLGADALQPARRLHGNVGLRRAQPLLQQMADNPGPAIAGAGRSPLVQAAQQIAVGGKDDAGFH